MAKICNAGIIRDYKKARSRSIHPDNPKWKDSLPRCGGSITFLVGAYGGCSGGHGEYDMCYCDSASVSVSAYCSRCSTPYYDGIYALVGVDDARYEIQRMLNG